jgi:hypothetical protein
MSRDLNCPKCHGIGHVSADGYGRDDCPICFSETPLSPTQGADARPVAIYQVRYFGSGDWRDVSEAEYQHARMHPDMRDRIVYATRDAPKLAEGWVLTETKNLDGLIIAMERADRKGYMPEAIQGAWDDFMCQPAIAPREKT